MTHIQMEDDYYQTTFYYGTLDEEYDFTVSVVYNSLTGTGNYDIDKIIWTDGEALEPNEKTKRKAEKKIKDLVQKWLFEKREESE
tara:strand:+ start:384 stop:638 length:255 start_codon:yes stop_codon:yes gene_type:complete